jgi:hypothetical protein
MSWFHGKRALKFGAEARFGANDEIRDRGGDIRLFVQDGAQDLTAESP